MNLYDVLAGQCTTHFERLFSQRFAGGGKTQTLTGVPPLSFKANGKPLVSWSMLGNGQQTGTPTPDNPVMPQFVGVRTENLFDGTKYVNTSINSTERWEYSESLTGSVYRVPCKPNTQYTLYLAENIDISIWRIRSVSTDVVPNAQSTSVPLTGSYANSVPASKSATFTTSSDAKYILFQTNESAYSDVLPVIMLIEGTTKIPYEPFGWAEKITNAGQTVPVYLGQTQTVRKIRKLVLDGTERWLVNWRPATGTYAALLTDSTKKIDKVLLCTHLELKSYDQIYYTDTVGVSTVQGSTYLIAIRVPDAIASNDTEFKAWLAAQYAAGTPVTVWYVLAEPETGIVNEPLAKIGTYADELSSVDAGVSIPTAKGQNVLTVDTDLQPSEMTITYKG